jgi:flagellar biogenesis protein FliO
MLASDYLQALKSLWGLGFAATIVGPLALWVPNLQPPWPEGSQVITAVFCIVAAILSFVVSRSLSERSTMSSPHFGKKKLVRILGSLALVLGLVSGIAYLVAFDLYVKSQSQQIGNEVRQIRIVIGTELREELRGTVEEPLQLLQDNGYNPERIWTRESLLRTRFQVFSSFLAMFLLITFGIGLLVPVSEVPTPKTSSRKNQTV